MFIKQLNKMKNVEYAYGKIESNKIEATNKIHRLFSEMQTLIVENKLPYKIKVKTDFRYELLTKDNKRYFEDHSSIFSGLFKFN